MEIIDSFKDAQTLCENKKVGWMIFEEKQKPQALNQGYLNCLTKLKETNDIVIVDLLHFTMMLNALWKNTRAIPEYPIELPTYIEYFNKHVDYLFFQDHHQQLDRIMGAGKDIGHLKTLTENLPYVYQYEANELITKTFIMIFLMYKYHYNLNITESANMWKCGYRSYFYRDFLQHKLGINMQILDPLFDSDGLIVQDNPKEAASVRKAMITLNNSVNIKKETPIDNQIEKVYVFTHPEYSKNSITEVLVTAKSGTKHRFMKNNGRSSKVN